ncbi:hypothetical protein [Holophaga foetida]|uniref:hypothetical protein n=1 Tax=Holophaga foetida TaxID=35839 RepID=UPI000247210E|nr:hypothetical protein [Holophaga foetida]
MKGAAERTIHLDPEERASLEEDLAQAREMSAMARKSGTLSEKGNVQMYLAALITELEGPQRALRHNRLAIRLYLQAGDPVDLAEARAILVIRLLEANRPSEALRHSRNTLEAFGAVAPEKRQDWIANRLAGLLLRAGHLEEGRAWLDLALKGPFSMDHGGLMEDLARLLPAREARDWQFKACAAYHRASFLVDEARALVTLARLERQLGDAWTTEALCREALAMAGPLEAEGLAQPNGIRRLVQRVHPKESRLRLLPEGQTPMRCH